MRGGLKMKLPKMNTKNILTLLTFMLILVSGIIVKQNPLFALPLFISISVSFLQADANRYSYLIGGLNSLIYGFVYINFKTYALAANAFLVSFPLQIITFLNWQKHSYKKSVNFKKMSTKLRIIIAIVFAIVWIGSFIALNMLKSEAAFLDNTASQLGTLVTFLQLFAFIEYTYLWIISTFINVLLNIELVCNDITRITYFIYSIYAAYCVVLSYISVKKLYKEQNELKGDAKNEM